MKTQGKRLSMKQSTFVSHVGSGKTLSAAYRAAYDVKAMNDNSVNVAASKLAASPNVKPALERLRTEIICQLLPVSLKVALDIDHKDSVKDRHFLLERICGFTKPR